MPRSMRDRRNNQKNRTKWAMPQPSGPFDLEATNRSGLTFADCECERIYIRVKRPQIIRKIDRITEKEKQLARTIFEDPKVTFRVYPTVTRFDHEGKTVTFDQGPVSNRLTNH